MKNYVAINAALVTALLMSSNVMAMQVYDDDTNALDVYGRLEAQIANGDESFAGKDSDTSARITGRLGFYMQRELSAIDNTRVIGKLEWQVRTEKNDTKLNEGDDLQARYIYAGFDNDTLGEFIVGRTKNPLYQVMKITDKYKNYTPNIYNFGISSIDTSYTYNRQDSTIQWNGDFDGHQVQVAYVMGNGENDRLDYGAMASYRKSIRLADVKITPALAFSQFKRNDSISDTSRKQHEQILLGVQMDYQSLSFGVTAINTDITLDSGDDKYTGFDSFISYKIGKIKLIGGYSQLNQDDKDSHERQDWRVEGQWTLARRTYLSLTYDEELASKHVETGDHAITLGLRYDF